MTRDMNIHDVHCDMIQNVTITKITKTRHMYFICILYVITYKLHIRHICNYIYITYVISLILHIHIVAVY